MLTKKHHKIINDNVVNNFVVSRRFELRQAEPKTAVLPLHHETILGLYFQKRCKDTIVFLSFKMFLQIFRAGRNFRFTQQ